MKICNVCELEKEKSKFHKKSSSKDGLANRCKQCKSLSASAYYLKNRSHILLKRKEYVVENKEKCALLIKKSMAKRQDYYRKKDAERYVKNKTRILAVSSEYRAKNKEKIKIAQMAYREKNRERLNAWQLEYQKKNKEKINKYALDYHHKRYRSDPVYALSRIARRRVTLAFANNGYSKKGLTKDMLGCTFEELKDHLESMFSDGMSWENRGEWHIDHVIPLASADSEEAVIKLCHYTNLQPLWAFDNYSKGAKMPSEIKA